MSEYFSTQTSIENRISASRLAGFIDRDGDDSPDSGALTAGFVEARAIIRAYLKEDYDHDTIDAWTDTTCPELINVISDWLCIRMFYVNNPRFQEVAQGMYDRAIDMLKQIKNRELDIYGIDRSTAHISSGTIETGAINSDFDPERELDDTTVRTTWILPDSRDLANY